MVTAIENQMYFDVWAFADMLGTCIGTLTEATDKEIRVVDQQPGGGSFTINRNSTQYSDLCTTDNLIRVRLDSGGPYDYDDLHYKFAFLIEEGSDTIVSTDEEGGELVTLSGRSAEVLLERAVVPPDAQNAGNQGEGFDDTTRADGQWHIKGSEHVAINYGTPGSLIRIFLRDWADTVPEPIPEVTHNFTVDDDSVSVGWTLGDTDWDIDVGTNGLEILAIVVQAGLFYHFYPSLLLEAYQNDQAQDYTGVITFTKGIDIRESGAREIHAPEAKSRVWVEGSTKNDRRVYREVVDSGVESDLGVRQGFVHYPSTPTTAVLDDFGAKWLADRKKRHDGIPVLGVVDTTGQQALIDYTAGDTVSVAGFSSVVFPDDAGKVHAITLKDNDAGNYDPILEFAAETWANESPVVGSIVTPSNTPGGAAVGTDTQPLDKIVVVGDDQLLLLWWWPATSALLLNGSAPVKVFGADTGMGYKNGPGTFTISMADSDAQFQYVVVTGHGTNSTGS